METCGVPGDNALHKLMTTLDRWRNEHNSTSVLPTTQLAKIKPIMHEGKLSKEVLTNARSATTRWTSVVTYGKTKLQDNQQCTENKPLFIQKLKVVLYVSSTIVCFRK